MKTTRIATLKKSSLINNWSKIGITSFIFKEHVDPSNKNGFTYEKIINGVSEIIKSSARSHKFNKIVSDARKAIYQKYLRNVGDFEVKILHNIRFSKTDGFIIE